MIDVSFLKQLERFSVILNKRVTSSYVGERKSVSGGQGLVIKDFIQYVFGDDFRRIDWKVYARSDKLFIRRFEEERNLTIHIIVDFSASMGFGKKPNKAEYASMLGVGFSYLAMKNNERFMLSTFADKLDLFRPRKGKKQLAAIVDYLNDKKPKGITELSKSLADYHKRINSKSYIVIISDFLYDPDQIKKVLARFKGHHICLVQVLDEIEMKLNLEGDFRLVDSETKKAMKVYLSPYLRKKYGEMLTSHRGQLEQVAKEARAEFYVTCTKDPIFDTFFRLLSRR